MSANGIMEIFLWYILPILGSILIIVGFLMRRRYRRHPSEFSNLSTYGSLFIAVGILGILISAGFWFLGYAASQPPPSSP